MRPDPPVIEVFCEGPRDHRHDRFLVAAYRRAHATVTARPALWTPLPSWRGVQLYPAEEFAPHPDESGWLRLHLRCRRCGLDAKHKAEPGFITTMFAVFDSLWLGGHGDIEVRGLVRRVTDIIHDQPDMV